MIYQKCLIHIKSLSIIHKAVAFYFVFVVVVFCCHECNSNALMKPVRGQNKLVRNVSLLVSYCSFEIAQLLKDVLSMCCLKLKSARNTNKSHMWYFKSIPFLAYVTVLSIEFSLPPIWICTWVSGLSGSLISSYPSRQ